MSLPQPDPPRLWGKTATETELSRGIDRLRITWNLITGAVSYGLRVDGDAEMPVQLGVTVTGFSPNTLHRFELRAYNEGGPSPWSVPFEMVTRPPIPARPTQDPADSSLWGVALQWAEPADFPGGDVARIEVWRRLHGTEASILQNQPLVGAYEDETDPRLEPKAYWLRLVVPSAAIPGNPLPGDNTSFFGSELHTSGPIVRRAVISRVQARSDELFWRRLYGGVIAP